MLGTALEEHLLLEDLSVAELLELEGLLEADAIAGESLGRHIGAELD